MGICCGAPKDFWLIIFLRASNESSIAFFVGNHVDAMRSFGSYLSAALRQDFHG